MKPMLRSIFDQTLWHDDEVEFCHDFDFDRDHDHDFDYDHDDSYHDDDASYLKSMHHPPERMKGQAIKGTPPSSGKARKPNDQERKFFRNQSEKGTTAQ